MKCKLTVVLFTLKKALKMLYFYQEADILFSYIIQKWFRNNAYFF